MTDEFGELRSIVHGVPSKEAFAKLCAHADTLSLGQPEIDYVTQQLESWPDDLARDAPERWVEALLRTEPPRTLRWTTTLALTWPETRADVLPERVAPKPTRYGSGLGHYIASLEQLAGLRALDLQHLFGSLPRIDHTGAEALTRSPYLKGLRELKMSFQSVGDEGARSLSRWEATPRLRVLVLAGNLMRPASVEPLLASLQAIEHLSFNTSRLGDEVAHALARAGHLVALRHLELDANELLARGVEALAGAPHLRHLETLGLNGANLSHRQAVEALAQSSMRPRTLRLAMTRMREADLSDLLQAEVVSRVEHLDLSYNGLGTGAAEAIAASPHLRHLRSLKLHYNHLGPAGAEALAQSPNVARLESLSISNNAIDDAGAAALATSPHLPKALRQIWQR